MAISEQLRDAIRQSGKSMNALARDSGIPQPMLTRFLNGGSLHLKTTDRLAAYFNLELRERQGDDEPRKPQSPKARRK